MIIDYICIYEIRYTHVMHVVHYLNNISAIVLLLIGTYVHDIDTIPAFNYFVDETMHLYEKIEKLSLG